MYGRVRVEQGNTWARLSGVPPPVVALIDAATSYPTDAAQTGSWQAPEAVLGEQVWDGWIHLCRFPAPDMVLVPSGLLDIAVAHLYQAGLSLEHTDFRIRPEPGVPDRGRLPLRPYQERAVEAVLGAGQAVLVMPPRAGKTLTMLEVVRSLTLPTLWVVPSLNIGKQTVRAADAQFGPNWAVFVSGKRAAIEADQALVVVTTEDTACRMPPEFFQRFQVLVFDECHHQAASSYRTIAQRCPHVFYRFGMTGTFFRSGNDELAMRSVLSRVAFSIAPDELVRMGHLVPASVAFLPVTCARVRSRPGKNFQVGVGGEGIFRNDYRNQLATWAAATLWSRNKRTLVLVGTKEQGWAITRALEQILPPEIGTPYKPVEFVSTDRKPKQCEELIQAFVSGIGVRVLVGTSMIGEGTDLPISDALVYAPGGKAEVSHTQAVYRVITAVPGKPRAVIVDFADRHNDTLLAHSQERLCTYYGQTIFRTQVLDDVGQFPGWLDQQCETIPCAGGTTSVGVMLGNAIVSPP